MTDLGLGLLAGLAGAGHCLAMCGPLSLSLGLSVQAPQHNLRMLGLIGLGKVSSYTAMGAFVGLAGGLAQLTWLAPVLFGLSGVLLVFMGLYGLGWRTPARWIDRGFSGLNPMGWAQRFLPIRSPWLALGWGIAWGWLPCGLVYTALLWAATAPGSADAALRMLGFGLGTLPAALGTGWLGPKAAGWLKTGKASKLAALVLLATGIYGVALAASYNVV